MTIFCISMTLFLQEALPLSMSTRKSTEINKKQKHFNGLRKALNHFRLRTR